ncbi:calcium-activated chloride channel regulator 2-like [Ixodes scapularis]|uniref:calcium-activated chloride channel regulator 2-like n=1 Tax=Ixodes scapularis TaxID=6945 RepID=UPI001A9F1084|nr:calcium-activated chloride channel regulator 2-like [Ixodes scapularis]
MQATRCSEEIEFKRSEIPDRFCPSFDTCMNQEYECNITFHRGDGAAKTSIMFLPYIAGVSQFCDNDTHNSEALNMQNERHFRLSTWDVIMQHDDFVRSTIGSDSCDTPSVTSFAT